MKTNITKDLERKLHSAITELGIIIFSITWIIRKILLFIEKLKVEYILTTIKGKKKIWAGHVKNRTNDIPAVTVTIR